MPLWLLAFFGFSGWQFFTIVLETSMINRIHSAVGQVSAIAVFSLGVLLILGTRQSLAQEVVIPPTPPASGAPTVGQSYSDNEAANTGDATLSEQVVNVLGRLDPFHWGPVNLHPHVAYRFVYGTGLRSQPGQQERSIIQTVSPGIGMTIGELWNLDYTAGMTFYSSAAFRDRLSHSVNFNGGTTYESWNLGLSQRVSISSSPRAETASQTDQETYTTGLSAAYRINDSTSLELGLSQDFRFLGGFTNALRDTLSWSTMDWLNHQWSESLSAAVGVGGGYVDVSSGSDMTFEQLLGRVGFGVTGRISLSLNGGAEVRQFLNSGQGSLITPIFGATMSYQPLEHTVLTLSANRSVGSSYFQNQVTETTSIQGGLEQQLLGHFSFSISGGFQNSDYRATTSGFSVNRTDDHTFVRTALSTRLLKRIGISVFYAHTENASNARNYAYSSDQTGFNVSYSY